MSLSDNIDFYVSIILIFFSLIKTLYQILFIPLITGGVLSLIFGMIKQKNKKLLMLGGVCIIIILILFLVYNAGGYFTSFFKSAGGLGTGPTSCFPDINSNCSFNQICCAKFNEKTDCCCEGDGLSCYIYKDGKREEYFWYEIDSEGNMIYTYPLSELNYSA
jgi:hypothetical protein